MTLMRVNLDTSGTLTEYYLTTALGETDYVMRLLWNRAGEYWTLDLYTQDMDPIFVGMTLTLYVDLLDGIVHPLIPEVRLFLCHTRSDNVLPTRQSLGKEVRMYWIAK